MKFLFSILMLLNVSAFAAKTVYTVKGMHCGGCEKMVTKSVCGDADLKSTFTSCSVKMIDEKNEIGQITFETADNMAVDQSKVQSLLTATDEAYKIIPNPTAKSTKKK